MLVYITLLLPLLGGALLPLWRFRSLRSRAVYVEAVVVATSVLMGVVLLGESGQRHDLFTVMDNLTLSFRVDGMSRVFAGLVAILWPLASLYGFEYMTHEERPNTFFTFYTMSYGVTLAIALSANLFTLYMFYECLTMITLPLVTHKQDAKSIQAGRRYLYYSIGGAALAFIGLIFIIHYGTSTDFVLGGTLDMTRAAGNEPVLRAAFLLAFIGFGTKAALAPMHAWLPSASVAPTPVTALLHAVAVVNAGAFAVLRITYYSFGTELLYGSTAQTIVLTLSCATILFGSAMAVHEHHLKRRLAYSTISNLSYMLMGAALMTPAGMVGSLTHLICHGLMKITLFYGAGAILVRTGKEYVQDLRGLGRVMPLTCGMMLVCSTAMVGIPPLCGFVSKWNLLTAAADTGLIMGVVAVVVLIISAVLTAIYLFGAILPMYFRPLNADSAALEGQMRDPGWMMKLPMALITAAVVLLGLFSTGLVTWLRQIASGAIL